MCVLIPTKRTKQCDVVCDGYEGDIIKIESIDPSVKFERLVIDIFDKPAITVTELPVEIIADGKYKDSRGCIWRTK